MRCGAGLGWSHAGLPPVLVARQAQPWRTAMFEAEVELERKSSFGPLLLVIALLATIVGLIAYVVMQSRQHLAPADAAQVVSSLLRAQGPASVQFHGGMVVPSVNDRPTDPHYRLLEKAGLLKLGKPQGRATPVVVNAAAEKEFK